MQKHHRRLSPSLVVAMVALFAALSGTAVGAATKIIVKKPEQLADKVVTAPKLADDAVTSRAVSDSTIGLEELEDPVVAAGVNKGIGSGGPFFMNPTSENVSVELLPGTSQFVVTFDRPVRHCQWAVTHAPISGQELARPHFFNPEPAKFDPNAVFVKTQLLEDVDGDLRVLDEPASFYLIGRC
jgi:hypothetical protein